MKILHHRFIIVLSVLILVSCVGLGVRFCINRLPIPLWDVSEQFVPLDSIQITDKSIQFYVNFSYDTAVLGFSVPNEDGSPRYFPMYASTYRGLTAVTLEVFVSETLDHMWVLSSWSGYEVLAYHRINTDRCMTRYGEITSFGKPTTEMLGEGSSRFPEMDTEKVSKLATIKYGKESPTRGTDSDPAN